MITAKRRTLAQIEHLKRDLVSGNHQSTKDFLQRSTSADILDMLREQKVLLKARGISAKREVVAAYKDASARIHQTPSELQRASNFADFILLAHEIESSLNEKSAYLLQQLPILSPIELLELIHELLQTTCDYTQRRTWNETAAEFQAASDSAANGAALSSRTLHAITGELNEIVFAGARLLNEAMRHADQSKSFRSGRRVRESALNILGRLFEVANRWNNIAYAVDMVSYGDWYVDSVELAPVPRAAFNVVDPDLLYARLIGIRSDIAMMYKGKTAQRFLREKLKHYLPHIADTALSYYSQQAASSIYSQQSIQQLLERMEWRLNELDAADDFLLAAAAATPPPESPSSVAEDYMAAVLLRWFLDVADFVQDRASNRVKKLLSAPKIPLDLIVGLFDDQSQPGSRIRIREALLNHVVTLPKSRHLELIDTPFFQLPNAHVYGSSILNAGRWASFVRSRNIKGGTVGRRYGSIWEGFITSALKDYGWSYIKTSVKIKKDGATLTDVDVLAVKDGLLLILQVKSAVGEGLGPYEHWKNRQIIEEGAEQAVLAETYIKLNATFLERVFSKKIASTIKHIQPAVLTTVHSFNGWKTRGIPVLSTGGLMTLLRGAQVSYSDAHGFVKGAERFGKGTTLTSEEFLALMQSPVEWRISRESIRLEHVPFNNEGVDFLIPSVMGGFEMVGESSVPKESMLKDS